MEEHIHRHVRLLGNCEEHHLGFHSILGCLLHQLELRSTGDTTSLLNLLLHGHGVVLGVVAAAQGVDFRETAGDGVENILLNAVTLFSQDCSMKRV